MSIESLNNDALLHDSEVHVTDSSNLGLSESNKVSYINYNIASTQANIVPLHLAHNSPSTVGSSPSSSISGLSSLEISTSSPIHSDTTSSNEGFYKRINIIPLILVAQLSLTRVCPCDFQSISQNIKLNCMHCGIRGYYD